MGDIVTGAGTVATSFSSAAVSLAGPFLRQASKQVNTMCCGIKDFIE